MDKERREGYNERARGGGGKRRRRELKQETRKCQVQISSLTVLCRVAKEQNCSNGLQHQLHFSSPPCADGRALQNKENWSRQ